ncbi:hypothetical protein IWQ57_007068, partial [Coemansia nantahalensis]
CSAGREWHGYLFCIVRDGQGAAAAAHGIGHDRGGNAHACRRHMRCAIVATGVPARPGKVDDAVAGAPPQQRAGVCDIVAVPAQHLRPPGADGAVPRRLGEPDPGVSDPRTQLCCVRAGALCNLPPSRPPRAL